MAVQWYRRAAEQGDVMAQFHLGALYRQGNGVLQDFVEAYAWLNVAAAQGSAEAATARDELAAFMSPEAVAKGQAKSQSWVAKSEGKDSENT